MEQLQHNAERAAVWEALVLAERALRDQPMQAFRTAASQRRRAEALDAVQAALRQFDGLDDHEPDNPRGVWCCNEHRLAHNAGL